MQHRKKKNDKVGVSAALRRGPALLFGYDILVIDKLRMINAYAKLLFDRTGLLSGKHVPNCSGRLYDVSKVP